MTFSTLQYSYRPLTLALAMAVSCMAPAYAQAFFAEEELSDENRFSASSLGVAFTVIASGDDYREIEITTDESEDLEYRLAGSYTGSFCSNAHVMIERNGVEIHNGPLMSFAASSGWSLLVSATDTWRFVFSPIDGNGDAGDCAVTWDYEANQVGYVHGIAFFDSETYSHTVSGADLGVMSSSGTPTGVFINEVLANPAGDENTEERIELFNNTGADVDLTGWYITDASANTIDLPDSLLTDGAFLVIDAHDLNNGTDTLTLFDATSTARDTFTYSDAGDTNEGDTASRCPDGGSVEEPTSATLGAPNDCMSVTVMSAFMFQSDLSQPQEMGPEPAPLNNEETPPPPEEQKPAEDNPEPPPATRDGENDSAGGNTDDPVTDPV